MTARPWLLCLATAWLAGCQYLPEQLQSSSGPSPIQSPTAGSAFCHAELPDFDNLPCLLDDWIAFGLASQRGDRVWREATLTRLGGDVSYLADADGTGFRVVLPQSVALAAQ